jgi:hypothetical protein
MIENRTISSSSKDGRDNKEGSRWDAVGISHNDRHLLDTAEDKFSQEKVLDAYRLLQQVQDQTILSDAHRAMCRTARACEEAIAVCLSELSCSTSGGGDHWRKQSESHGKRDTVIYYKVPAVAVKSEDRTATQQQQQQHLICRVETAIEQDLLPPLLSVFNESDLYGTWMPRFRFPKMGIRESTQLGMHGMLNQTVLLTGDSPWPFADREAVLRSVVVDDIDSNGYFAVRIHTVDEITGGGIVPPPHPNAERMEFEGALLFRPILAEQPGDEPKILVVFKV